MPNTTTPADTKQEKQQEKLPSEAPLDKRPMDPTLAPASDLFTALQVSVEISRTAPVPPNNLYWKCGQCFGGLWLLATTPACLECEHRPCQYDCRIGYL